MNKAFFAFAWIALGCGSGNDRSDAYGNFEAIEITVTPEVSGRLIFFNVEEGMSLDSGAVVGLIDTVQLDLRRRQLRAAKQSVFAQSLNARSQVAVIEEQERVLLREKERIENLLKEHAATQKQWDDIDGQLRVLEKQKASTRTQESAILSEAASLDAQIAQIDDQIRRSWIVNPVSGTVLTKTAEPGEIIAAGRTLYQIADLTQLDLRVYISGEQLPHVKIGQAVDVRIDRDASTDHHLQGHVSWIASRAEFTPKIIQTKEERVNQVYAVKIRVANDGRLKIGMPGEAVFASLEKTNLTDK
jgi:HlyD family secretion protein